MSTSDFLLIYAIILATMVVWRVAPILFLRGRSLPERVESAIGLIPSAAFAALVANDLIRPQTFQTDPVAGLLPLAAAAVVLLVARKTGSLVWCAVVGMACYGALVALFG